MVDSPLPADNERYHTVLRGKIPTLGWPGRDLGVLREQQHTPPTPRQCKRIFRYRWTIYCTGDVITFLILSFDVILYTLEVSTMLGPKCITTFVTSQLLERGLDSVLRASQVRPRRGRTTPRGPTLKLRGIARRSPGRG